MARHRYIATLGSILLASGAISSALASGPERYTFDVPQQELKFALRSITRQSGLQLFAEANDLRGRTSVQIHATLSPQEALDQLLAGTGLEARIEGKAVFIRGRSQAPAVANSPVTPESEILVTGSHLAGQPLTSPVISQTRKQIEDAGQLGLGDAIRSIPQNFAGGQNPAVGFTVPYGSGENNGGGSALNLRGLGPDATLTLLDGHRIPYGSTREGIDISAIPVAALDRIDIVTDGSSAIYGSDAVGGVANVILRRDFNGLSTSATVGGATDGGDTLQRYDAVAGRTWSSGGVMLAYEYGHSTEILGRDRSYSEAVSPGLTLLPSDQHHNVVLTGHQDFGNGIEFSIDGTYNWRHSSRQLALGTTQNDPIEDNPSTTNGFNIAPSLRFEAGSSWSITLDGSYGQNHVRYGTNYTSGGATTPLLKSCACNSAAEGEVFADGTVFELPGGPVKAAIGGGYRTNTLRIVSYLGGSFPIDRSQGVYYGFGELSIPIIAPAQDITAVHRLSFDAAGRYERYPGIGDVFTPKLGGLYEPVEWLSLKASWGRSFKAPTLYQLYNNRFATLYNASDEGGAGNPATATAIYLEGANPSLKPERATSWAASATFRPAFAPAAELEIGWFDIRYRDRIVTPIVYSSESLSTQSYADRVELNPSQADIATALGGRDFNNYSSYDYNPSDVVAIINNDFVNAANQHIRGIDASGSYRAPLAEGSLSLSGNIAYLKSDQKLTALQPRAALSGTLFNPPHVRGRGGVVFETQAVTAATYFNYTGPLRDNRTSTPAHVNAQSTIDIAFSWRLPASSSLLKGIKISAAVQDLFNAKPDVISTSAAYETPYDSTNYSPVGRFLSVTLTKDW